MPYKDPDRQKAAQRAHYEKEKSRWAERNRDRREGFRLTIRAAKDQPCADCGQRFHYAAMDFDHRPGEQKRFSIGKDIARISSKRALLDEIAKCDIVCANCHRIRSFERKQHL